MPWNVGAATGGRIIFEGGWRRGRAVACGSEAVSTRASSLVEAGLRLQVVMAVSVGLGVLITTVNRINLSYSSH